MAAIPNKEIVIGEFGWPSHGRMREGALPSPSNQARAIEETLTLGKRENFRVNVIEAFDQPWKRALEGSTGRYWGIFDRSTQGPKFALGGAVSNHPHWLLGALFGILLAALTFGIAATAGRQKKPVPYLWPKIAGIAFLPAVMFGLAVETIPIESYSVGGWLRSLTFALVAAAAPIVCADACAVGRALPTFAAVLGRSGERRGGLHWALGGAFIVLVLLALQAALGLVFDPRYRDFPFAPLTAAVVPFLVLMIAVPRPAGARAVAETVAGAALIACAGYIAINESFANWQAVWFCAAVAGLASFCCGRGTCQTQNKKAQREACEIGIVQHDAEGRRSERQRHQHDRRPEQIERGGGQRHPAEDAVIEQNDRQPERIAQPGPQAALAGERHGVVLQRHVAQIERLAERQKAYDQKPIGLAGGGQEQCAFHCGSFPDGVGAIHNHRR